VTNSKVEREEGKKVVVDVFLTIRSSGPHLAVMLSYI
jgi:hypothetical protein